MLHVGSLTDVTCEQSQLQTIRSVGSQLLPLIRERLPQLQELECECDEAKIEDNDYTVYSFEDLAFEAQLLQECPLRDVR